MVDCFKKEKLRILEFNGLVLSKSEFYFAVNEMLFVPLVTSSIKKNKP
jgi:hypothetical protein